MTTTTGRLLAGLVIVLGLAAAPAQAQTIDAQALRPKVQEFLKETAASLVADPVLVEAVRKANADHAGLSDADIQTLDKQWRAEAKTGTGTMIKALLGTPASDLLRKAQGQSVGLMAEIFVFDAKGLNVAQTNITSDYYQGDEPKYQMTFMVGPAAVHVEDPNFDESANAYVSTASITLVDPETGAAIGAMTVNVDLGKL